MKHWIRRVRGALGIGLTWAAGWAPVGAIAGWATALVLDLPLGVVTTNYAAMFGALGFVGGTVFSTVLTRTERGRSFDQLSLPRFAAWGGLGGLLLGATAVVVGLLGAGFTILGGAIVGASVLLGATSATGTLVLARSANGRVLLEDGDSGPEERLPGSGVRQPSGAQEQVPARAQPQA